MTARYDVIVAGLGAMGSLALHHLAQRGHRVLGFDRFSPPHAMGSSHGDARIIREAYFEDPRYVPLVQRAYELWEALSAHGGVRLFRQTGGLMLGRPDSELVRGARLSADLHHLPHDVLDAREVARRFPAFRPDGDMIGVWEPRAGILAPELAIDTALHVAQRNGAAVHTGESLVRWEAIPGGVDVVTTQGRYRAASLVIAVGAWTPDVCRELSLPLIVQRNVQMWFTPTQPTLFAPDAFPVFISEYAPGAAWYGFPDTGLGLKVARHHHGAETHPDALTRTVSSEEVDGVRALLRQYLPHGDGVLRQTAACMYTNAPDDHFLIGPHPASPATIIACPCSGHGFKFASVIGEILADLSTGHTPRFDLTLFAPDRFSR
jgi:sarcosine oxidase